MLPMQGVQVGSLVGELSNCDQAHALQLLSPHLLTAKLEKPECHNEYSVQPKYIHTHTHTHIHIHSHTHTYTYIYTNIQTHTHIHIHSHTHTYTYTHIHIYIHTYKNQLGSFVATHMPGPTLETLFWCKNQASFFFF